MQLDPSLLDRVIEDRFQGYFQKPYSFDNKSFDLDWSEVVDPHTPYHIELARNRNSRSSTHNTTHPRH